MKAKHVLNMNHIQIQSVSDMILFGRREKKKKKKYSVFRSLQYLKDEAESWHPKIGAGGS